MSPPFGLTHCRLGGHIVGQTGRGLLGELRRGVDDFPTILAIHDGEHQAGHEKDAAQMDRHHPVPFVDGHVLDVVGARDRGVDEEISGTAEAHRQRPRTLTKPSSAITSR
jgi:hypothetical protein